MAFPTTSVLDTFNRTNEGPPPSASWTADTAIGPNLLQVVSNQVASSSAEHGFAYWNPITPGPDSEAYLTIATKPISTRYMAVYVRYDPTGNNGYELEVDVSASTDTSQHYRVDNAVFTALGAAISQEFANGDGMGLEIIGSTLQAYRNSGGTWAALGTTRTDTTYSGAGRIAIQLGDTGGRADDFGGGTVSSGRTVKVTRSNPLGMNIGMGWRMPI